MRFDAYAGNVWSGVPASEVAEVVAHSVSASVQRARPGKRQTDCFQVCDGGDMLGWVGRDQVNDAIYFEFKGSRTPETSEAIRSHFKDKHSVSRVDSCEDFDEPGAFDKLTKLIDRFKDPRVQSQIIAPRDGNRGQTIYWGSPKSRAMIRLYEAGLMKDRLHFGRPGWVRAENQLRPGKSDEKWLAATLSPLQVWGFARWSMRVAEAIAQVEVPRFAPTSEPATFDKTTLYFARAFRRHLSSMLEDFGDWVCIGREIEAIWQADDLAAAQTAEAIKRNTH